MNEAIEYTSDTLEQLKDEELIAMYKQGDATVIDVLIQRYKGIVRNKIKTNYFIGADREDLIQEGMIGVFKAICDYDPSREVSFKSFANLCIARQLSTAFKMATRQKHKPLNTSISLDIPVNIEDDKQVTLMDIIDEGSEFTPEELVIYEEDLKNLKENIKKSLSPLEWEVLVLHMQGIEYKEIAKRMNKSSKSIDNALQRIKRKVSQAK